MLYHILSFSALLQLSLSSKRLLQQMPPPNVPEFVPVQTTAAATTTVAPPQTTAAPPQTTVNVVPVVQTTTTQAATTIPPVQVAPITTAPPPPPPLPVQTTTSTTVAPVAPQTTTTTKAQTTIAMIPLDPGYNGLPGAPGVIHTYKKCDLAYTDPASCAGKTEIIANPSNAYQLSCMNKGACAQSHFTFQYNQKGGRLESVDRVTFGGQYAAWGATLVVDNQQGGNKVTLERVECLDVTSCDGLVIILNNGHLNDMECPEENYCANCWVKETALDPQPKECYGW